MYLYLIRMLNEHIGKIVTVKYSAGWPFSYNMTILNKVLGKLVLGTPTMPKGTGLEGKKKKVKKSRALLWRPG